jgi:hypothetical protein
LRLSIDLPGEEVFSYWATDLSLAHDHKHMKINNRSLQVGHTIGQLLTDPAEQRFNNDGPIKIGVPRHAAVMHLTLRRRLGGKGFRHSADQQTTFPPYGAQT